MPDSGDLFHTIRNAVLQHVYERQVRGRKWGVDYFWARKDIAAALSRPGATREPGQRTSSTGSSRRQFDWGFEMTFMSVIERLAEDGLLEVRVVAPLPGGRANSLRVRDYKLTDSGIQLCELRYGAPLPGEDSAEKTPLGLKAASATPPPSVDDHIVADAATSQSEIDGDGITSDEDVQFDPVPQTRVIVQPDAVQDATASGSSSGIHTVSRPSERRPVTRRDTPSGRHLSTDI